VRGPWLDRQLVDGVASWQSPTHAARALQLTSERRRRALARSLQRLVEHAGRPAGLSIATAVVPPCREQVHSALPVILEICSQLGSRAPVDACGVARLQELLSDGGGPCYVCMYPDALMIALQDVSRWMEVND
jgi:hypothetical protein